MKKLLFPFILVFSLLITTSCEKNEDILSLDGYDSSILTKSEIEQMSCGESKVVPLMAGQNINVGSVTISNDKDNLYVVYETTEHWYLQEVHMYVGPESKIPLNGGGNPVIGHFPYSKEDIETQNYVFTVPLSELDDCFSVVTHAVVSRILYGETSQTETAFGCGDKDFPGNRWGCYTDYCVEECDDDECFDVFGRKEIIQYVQCLQIDIDDSTLWGWSSRVPYKWLIDYAAINHYLELPIYINADECDINSGTQIGRVEFTAGDNGQDLKVSYVIYPYDYSNYEITEINLYAGVEENPYNEDGSLKPTIGLDNFYSEEFSTPVKRTNPITLPWSGDETSQVYIIPHAKVCKITN